MDETEKLQRQLQRLSRERSFARAQRGGQPASEGDRGNEEGPRPTAGGTGQKAAAQGIRALQQLDRGPAHAVARRQDQGLSQGMDRALRGVAAGCSTSRRRCRRGSTD